MAWDPALLRKYNTTSHFRLLNQIRSELREQPIQRPLVTSRTGGGGGGGFGGGGRRAGRSSGGGSGSSGSGAGAAAASFSPAPSSHANTRRRSAAPASPQPISSSPERDHQPIVAVPVLTDVVMPDSHA